MASTSANKHLLLYLCALSTMTIDVTVSFDREKGEIGETGVVLDGKCCANECNLGEFLVDAYFRYGVREIRASSNYPLEWNKLIIAMLNGSAIQGSIGKGPITKEQLSKDVLPDPIVMGRVVMSGSVIKRAMDNAFENFNGVTPLDNFVQVSGLRMTFDMREAKGNRLYTSQVAPGYLQGISDIDEYIVILSKHMWDNMKQVYAFEKFRNLEFVEFGKNLLDIAVETIAGMNTPILKTVDGRLTFIGVRSSQQTRKKKDD